MTKLYITRLHVDIWACCCPDVPHGAFLTKEDAQKLAKHNFEGYRELWKDMDDFKILHEEPDNYVMVADHAEFHTYVEEVKLADNQSDLTQLTGNRTSLYLMRPDATCDKGFSLPPITIPYTVFTNEDDALKHLDHYFQLYVKAGEGKEDLKVKNWNEDDKSIYWKGVFASFLLEETNFVTNVDKYITDGENQE